jgi:isoquinoline 1-oxidoreductase beta subunit
MDSLSAHGLRGSYDPSRRGFLITMLGAGVMLGYARCGLAAVEGIVSGAQWASSASELFEPTIWYGIDPGGEVTINIKRAEMGQHVGTALARIVADELEVDWGKVSVPIQHQRHNDAILDWHTGLERKLDAGQPVNYRPVYARQHANL